MARAQETAKAVLVAATPGAREVLAPALSGLPSRAEIVFASTYEEALAAWHAYHPDVAIVTYFFDGLRPYRLVKWLQERRTRQRRLFIILARVIPLQLTKLNQEELENAYRAIGVDYVFGLEELAGQRGRRTALTKLGGVVAHCLNTSRQRRVGAEFAIRG